jgi:type VI secretion system protein VasG
MAEIKRSILFGKLNPIAYKPVKSAIIFCKMRGHPYVELVPWINQIFQLADSDLHRIIKHFGLFGFRSSSKIEDEDREDG